MQGEEFVRRMKQGDGTVFEELMPMILPLVYGASQRYNLYNSKEDVLQEVAFKVYKNWMQYREESKLSTWIYSIARNHCLDQIARNVARGSDVTISYSAEDSDGHKAMASQPDHSVNTSLEQRLCVDQVIAELEKQPPARKGSIRVIDILSWIVEHKPSTKELAQFLDATESAAKERKSTILKQFRALCEKFCGHEKCAFNQMEDNIHG